MKMNRFVCLFVCLILAVCLCACAEEPSPTPTPMPTPTQHEHTFSTEWSTDAQTHYYVCSCGEKSQSASHSFGEWNTVTAPTETAVGKDERVCSVCSYTDTTSVSYNAPKYTVSFYDENGTLLTAQTVAEDVVPSYTYTKTDTAEWDYTVEGWASTKGGEKLSVLPAACADAAYYAVVSSVKRTYTVTFSSNGGSNVSSVTKEYGSTVTAPTAPTKTGYSFVAWCSDTAAKTAVTWPITLTGNVTLYAAWNEQLDIKGYLEVLLSDVIPDPYAYIPDTMKPEFKTLSATAVTNYADFVNVTSLPTRGFGEQWHMITDNLNQSELFFNALTVVEGLTTSSVAAFQTYLDNNPASTAHHTFASGIYSVTIDFDGTVISYVLDYTATFPLVGQQTAQIALTMNVQTGTKTVRVQLGNPNALYYEADEASYTFAIKYLGVRSAYFHVEKDKNDHVSGHINEYLTVAGKGLHSAADFYIGEDYVSAVGNKASGIPGFTGYINEVYDAKTGDLLGYEVRETLSSITYNTLWFDLNDVNGITSVKYKEKTEEEAAAFYINGSQSAFVNKLVGLSGKLKAASRRFDIEMRTQYFYQYNETDKVYEEVSVSVPMLFVQAEQMDSFSADFNSANKTSASISIDSADLKKITDDYATLVDAFIANKADLTEEAIQTLIGQPVSFE